MSIHLAVTKSPVRTKRVTQINLHLGSRRSSAWYPTSRTPAASRYVFSSCFVLPKTESPLGGRGDLLCVLQQTRTLENISRSLSQSVKQIAESRDTLKKRWDLDRHLQLQSVTEQLGALNDCFTRSEDALKDSIAVIEDRLLR